MTDNASMARPYAKAVFELAQEAKSFDAWAVALNQLSAISLDEDFSTLVNDPRIENNRIIDLMIELSKDVLPIGGENFIKLLVENDRLAALTDIEILYSELMAQAQQSVNASVVTAIALTDVQKASLEAALEARLGLKVTLEETIDETLIGGAIVKAGDLVIDGSAKGRIDKLATVLAR